MSSNYRPREAAQRARSLAARQFREFPPPVVGDEDGPEDADDDYPDDYRDEGDDDAPGIPEWRRRIADRTPSAVRSARVGVGPRAAVGVLLVACLVAALLGFLAWRSWPRAEPVAGQAVPERSAPVVASAPVPSTPGPSGPGPSASGPSISAPSSATSVVVHVAGRVVASGIVTLPAGSRVGDALAAAGGAAGDADLDGVNLARVLVDGEQVLVPGPGETVAAPAGGSAAPAPGPLDLNTAGAADLDTLPGVGEVLAGRIVAWREENGEFTSVDDLGEVQGIGPKVLEDLRDLVTV